MAGFMTAPTMDVTEPTMDVTAGTASAGNPKRKPGRRGRPPKPGRVRVNAFVPAALAKFLADDAAANGMSGSDRLAEILAAWYSG